MDKENQCVFDSVHTVAGYLKTVSPGMGDLRLQNTLYFLFAYFGASVKATNPESLYKYLFPAIFEVQDFGSFIREVDEKYRNTEYGNNVVMQEYVSEIEKYDDVKQFIDEWLENINSLNEFKIIGRIHLDDCWQEAYKNNKSTMNNDVIINEYFEKYL
jgi:hypothetical protein